MISRKAESLFESPMTRDIGNDMEYIVFLEDICKSGVFSDNTVSEAREEIANIKKYWKEIGKTL